MTQAAGGIKRLTARRHGGRANAEAPARTASRSPRTPEELDKLQRIVSNALGADPTRGDT